MKPRSSRLRSTLTEYGGMLLACILLVAVFGSRAPHFLSAATFRTIANEIPDAILLATGMTLVLVVAGIDLSVGSVLGLSGAMLGMALADWHLSLVPAILVALATGGLCGLINGLVSAKWSLPSFIVTLGMLEMARGGAYLASNSQTKYVGGPVEKIAEASVFGLSAPFIVALAVAAVIHFTLFRTVFGRHALAVGANEQAARFSGINPVPVKVVVFALSGLLAAGAAVMNVSRLASADPNAGTGFELQAIAAAVIGGTSLMGGRGTVIGSCFGVIIIALLENGLAQVGAQDPVKRMVTGAVIVLAVLLDQYRARSSKR